MAIETNEIIDVKTLPPFKKFIMSIGAIPTSYLESMSYAELLMWFCNYLQNTVIPTVNNNADALQELIKFIDEGFPEIVNNKLDEMAEDGTLEELLGDKAVKKVDYFKITSSMTEEEILECFAHENDKVIEFETGDYEFTDHIVLTSNTKVLLNGSRLITNNNSRIMGYASDSTFTAYNGISNVTFENGYIEQMVVLMHNTNITFNNIEWGYKLVDHALQIAGCKNVKITNCTFHGSAISSNGNNQELIQLESCTYLGQPYLEEGSESYDNYGNFNIEISNNKFTLGDEINTRNYICIGNHSKNSSNEYYNENIFIKDNIFETTNYSDIRPVGFNNCVIENNIFNQSIEYSGHIVIRPSFKNKNLTIRNNVFNGGTGAITNVSVEQNDNYLIENNKILMTYTGTAMYLQSLTNSQILNNYIEYQTNGIGLAQTTGLLTDNIKIDGNSFVAKLDVASDYAINVFQCTNLVVTNNYCDQFKDFAFIFYRGTASKYPMYYANNYIYNRNFNPNDVDGTNVVYNRIYNSLRRLYQTTNGSTYTALTNTTVSWDFTQFNKGKLVVCENGDASKISIIEIAPYELFGKLSKNRSYTITSNISGTIHYATFSITDDNKFSYSGDGSLTLISLYCYNELQI